MRHEDGKLAVALHGVEPASYEHCALIRDWLADPLVDHPAPPGARWPPRAPPASRAAPLRRGERRSRHQRRMRDRPPFARGGAAGTANPMKLLVLTPEPIDAEILRSVAGDEAADAEVLVITHAVNESGLRFWMSDADDAIEHAKETAEETKERLEEGGIDAVAETGEAEPPVALQDALATFKADQIVIFTHSDGQLDYREADGLDDLGVPVHLRRDRAVASAIGVGRLLFDGHPRRSRTPRCASPPSSPPPCYCEAPPRNRGSVGGGSAPGLPTEPLARGGGLGRRIIRDCSANSRGSEAALLVGVHFPRLVHGVIATAPSSKVLSSAVRGRKRRSPGRWRGPRARSPAARKRRQGRLRCSAAVNPGGCSHPLDLRPAFRPRGGPGPAVL